MSMIDQPLEEIAIPVLDARIAHLAHDLDKSLNTLVGEAGFATTCGGERLRLETSLAEWRRRKLPLTENIEWAEGLLTEVAAVLQGRQTLDPASVAQDWSGSGLMEVIRARRSVRRWKTTPVEKRLIEQVLEAARWAPSACNRQSCRYLVVREEQRRGCLARVRESWLAKAPVLILVGADRRNYHPEEVDFVPYMDAAMAVQNLLLAAHAASLGAVIVKAANRDIKAAHSATDVEAVRHCWELLRIPRHFIPVAVVGLGWPARIPAPPPRLPKEQVVHWEAFAIGESLQASAKPKKRWQLRLFLYALKWVKFAAYRFGIRIYVTCDE